MKLHITLIVALLSAWTSTAAARDLTVAVAANFVKPMRALTEAFNASHPYRVRLVSGSSGKLYAQIRNGAPYDAFFSADEEKPAALEREGMGRARFTYAIGSLTLWSPDPNLITDSPQVLVNGSFHKVAVANPKLAPYGLAAAQTLAELELNLANHQVFGENIAQTYQFVATGNASLGFVAKSQIIGAGGSSWHVPEHMHAPIRQDAIALSSAESGVNAFFAFVRSPASQAILSQYGYRQPGRGD